MALTARALPPRYHRIPRYTVGPKPRRRTELGLLVFGWVIITALYVLASLGKTSHIPPHIGPFLAVLCALTVVGHLANRWLAPDAHPILLPTVVLLNGMGYVVIARYDAHFAAAQAGWTALGILLYIATLIVVRRSRDLDRYRYLLLLIGVILILLPLAPGIGLAINVAHGNTTRLWIHLGSFQFQPIEIAKILLCIFFASYLSEKKELLSIPTARLGNRLILDPRPLVPMLIAWGFAMLVIAKEDDIGFALLLFTLFMVMLWIATGRVGYLVVGLVLFALGAFAVAHLFPQFHERVTLWLDPWSHTSVSAACQAVPQKPQCLGGSGDQLANGWYALGLGGVGGVGLGLGNACIQALKLCALPISALASDMIFAGIGYQLGLMGTAAVAIAFLILVGTGLRIAQGSRTDFARLVAVGLTTLLGFQSFFIMAGVTRLLPFTGITLPFMAYGGSSLVTNYVLIAILMRISQEGATTTAELASGVRQPGDLAFTDAG
ncbi:MAG: FtsW/RodA/SpoVE family cell cycle protein [Acidimicrobiales bacterium]